MGLVGMMVGGLIPTLLLSRLFLWVTRSWNGGLTRLGSVHAASWLVAAFIAGMGMADGGAFAGVAAAGIYAVPQAVWLVVDVVRHKRRTTSADGDIPTS